MKAEAKIEVISGIVPITEADYNRHPATRNSDLGHLLKSPAHYWHHKNSPREATDAMELGTAIHFGVLEPEKFYARYAALPETCDLRTKLGQAAKAAIAESGKMPLKAAEFQTVERIIEAVYSHPNASKYLSGGKVEHAYFWTDPESGVECKAKPDYLRDDGIYIDLKSTEDASADEFVRSVMKYGYPRQAAFYQDGLKAATGRTLAGTVFIAVEKKAPHGIGVFMPDDLMIEYGRAQYKEALATLAECLRANQFPGYTTETQALSLPGWVK